MKDDDHLFCDKLIGCPCYVVGPSSSKMKRPRNIANLREGGEFCLPVQLMVEIPEVLLSGWQGGNRWCCNPICREIIVQFCHFPLPFDLYILDLDEICTYAC